MNIKSLSILTVLVIINATVFGQNEYGGSKLDTANKKISIIWECLPTYDEKGNCYRLEYHFDHIPDRQDSLDFEIKCNKDISDMIMKAKKKSK